MSDKQIYELTRSDIIRHPIWYFPMNETVQDECTIRPVSEDFDFLESSHQIIVKTLFQNAKEEFIGYLYWSAPGTVSETKPTLFLDDIECITFWNGMRKASWEAFGLKAEAARRSLPLVYKSIQFKSLHSISGILEGLYYTNDGKILIVS